MDGRRNCETEAESDEGKWREGREREKVAKARNHTIKSSPIDRQSAWRLPVCSESRAGSRQPPSISEMQLPFLQLFVYFMLPAIFLPSTILAAGRSRPEEDFLSLKNCEDPLRKPMLVPSGRQVCCDLLIKNLAETALEIAGIRPGTREFRDVRRMGKVIRDFLQKHYEKAFEVLTAQIDITQRTNYKGRKICTWVTNGIHFAAYETPGLYNIHDKLLEEYYDSIANKETGNKRRPKTGSSRNKPNRGFGRNRGWGRG